MLKKTTRRSVRNSTQLENKEEKEKKGKRKMASCLESGKTIYRGTTKISKRAERDRDGVESQSVKVESPLTNNYNYNYTLSLLSVCLIN